MKQKTFFSIAIRIIIIFTIFMFAIFIPDNLREFFGDTLRETPTTHAPRIDEWWNWGTRHYWYCWMCVLLFTLSMVDLIVYVINAFNEKE